MFSITCLTLRSFPAQDGGHSIRPLPLPSPFLQPNVRYHRLYEFLPRLFLETFILPFPFIGRGIRTLMTAVFPLTCSMMRSCAWVTEADSLLFWLARVFASVPGDFGSISSRERPGLHLYELKRDRGIWCSFVCLFDRQRERSNKATGRQTETETKQKQTQTETERQRQTNRDKQK